MDGPIRDTFKYGPSNTQNVIELPYISKYLEEKTGTDVHKLN